jgi:hypothetical protein
VDGGTATTDPADGGTVATDPADGGTATADPVDGGTAATDPTDGGTVATDPADGGTAATGPADGGTSKRPDDTGPCATADDCTFTNYEPGAICPMLCSVRAVTKAAARELDRRPTGRNGRAMHPSCPVPLCRPPQHRSRLACVQNRCVAQPLPDPDNEN